MNVTALEILTRIVRNEVLKDFERDSDIITAAALIDVVGELGIGKGAFAMNAPVVVVNAAFARCMDENEGVWPTRKVANKWAQNHSAWSVGLGVPPLEDRKSKEWNGHLTVIVPPAQDDIDSGRLRHVLVDPSADSATRLGQDINITPLVTEVSQEFLRGELFHGVSMNGCFLTYNPFPTDFRFMGTDAWTNSNARKPAVLRSLARLTEYAISTSSDEK